MPPAPALALLAAHRPPVAGETGEAAASPPPPLPAASPPIALGAAPSAAAPPSPLARRRITHRFTCQARAIILRAARGNGA